MPDSENFIVRDSGKREEYDNGFVRDTEEGKEDFARILLIPGLELVPVEMLERMGAHMLKGAQKYGVDNWRRATGSVAKARFARSLVRHIVQLLKGDRTEDHAAAVWFNTAAYEFVQEDVVTPKTKTEVTRPGIYDPRKKKDPFMGSHRWVEQAPPPDLRGHH